MFKSYLPHGALLWADFNLTGIYVFDKSDRICFEYIRNSEYLFDLVCNITIIISIWSIQVNIRWGLAVYCFERRSAQERRLLNRRIDIDERRLDYPGVNVTNSNGIGWLDSSIFYISFFYDFFALLVLEFYCTNFVEKIFILLRFAIAVDNVIL